MTRAEEIYNKAIRKARMAHERAVLRAVYRWRNGRFIEVLFGYSQTARRLLQRRIKWAASPTIKL